MNQTIPSFLLTNEQRVIPSGDKKRKYTLSFIDRTLKKAAGFIKIGYIQCRSSSRKELL